MTRSDSIARQLIVRNSSNWRSQSEHISCREATGRKFEFHHVDGARRSILRARTTLL